MRLAFYVGMVLLATAQFSHAQVFDKWIKPDSVAKIRPFAAFQVWTLASTNQQVDSNDDGVLEPIDPRLNFLIRRARLGLRGKPYKNLRFVISLAFDLVGRDVLVSSLGGINNPTPNVALFDTFISWKISNNDVFHLTGGFFRPQVSRESITSGWLVSSFEKAVSQNYIRFHLVGTGPGRAVGVNLGGQKQWSTQFGFTYNVGIFLPQNTGDIPNTAGFNWSPLITIRPVFHIGQPELEKYGFRYTLNYWGERKGVSIGVSTSQQGETDSFDKSDSYGIDWLWNQGPFAFSGDWHYMRRTNGLIEHQSYTGNVRVSYNLVMFDRYFLEPALMYVRFNGGSGENDANDATAVSFFDGTDEAIDFGVNWYLNKARLKLALHYTWQYGTGENNFSVRQPGIEGQIQRGNYLGIGFNGIF